MARSVPVQVPRLRQPLRDHGLVPVLKLRHKHTRTTAPLKKKVGDTQTNRYISTTVGHNFRQESVRQTRPLPFSPVSRSTTGGGGVVSCRDTSSGTRSSVNTHRGRTARRGCKAKYPRMINCKSGLNLRPTSRVAFR